VTLALEEFIARRKQKALIELMGKLSGTLPSIPRRSVSPQVTLFVDTSVWSLAFFDATPRRQPRGRGTEERPGGRAAPS